MLSKLRAAARRSSEQVVRARAVQHAL